MNAIMTEPPCLQTLVHQFPVLTFLGNSMACVECVTFRLSDAIGTLCTITQAS